jgi:hypothetical protein
VGAKGVYQKLGKEIQREQHGAQVESPSREHVSALQVLSKPTLTHRRADLGNSQPDEGGLSHSQATHMSTQLSYF